MQSAIPAQERPARIALTVELNCVNPTRKPGRVSCDLLSFLLDLPSGTPEASLGGSRSSGAKKSLEFQRSVRRVGLCRNSLLVRLPFQFHFLHLFICHRHCV